MESGKEGLSASFLAGSPEMFRSRLPGHRCQEDRTHPAFPFDPRWTFRFPIPHLGGPLQRTLACTGGTLSAVGSGASLPTELPLTDSLLPPAVERKRRQTDVHVGKRNQWEISSQ